MSFVYFGMKGNKMVQKWKEMEKKNVNIRLWLEMMLSRSAVVIGAHYNRQEKKKIWLFSVTFCCVQMITSQQYVSELRITYSRRQQRTGQTDTGREAEFYVCQSKTGRTWNPAWKWLISQNRERTPSLGTRSVFTPSEASERRKHGRKKWRNKLSSLLHPQSLFSHSAKAVRPVNLFARLRC